MTGAHTTLEIPSMEFIARLIRHIPEKGFHVVRRGGLNANHSELREITKKAVARLYGLPRLRSHLLLTWRQRVRRRTGVDPLVCPHCKREMRCVECGVCVPCTGRNTAGTDHRMTPMVRCVCDTGVEKGRYGRECEKVVRVKKGGV